MNKKTEKYLKGRFRDYYRLYENININKDKEREFAFIKWDDNMIRHKSKRNIGDINTYLSNKDYKHIYYSSARYKKPEKSEMDKKIRKGTDLIFDLDADHLERVNEEDITHSKMLKEVKKELKNLIEILEKNLNYNDYTIYFSGGRGYHIHIRKERIQKLTSDERKEITKYITIPNLKLEDLIKKGNSYQIKSDQINEIKHYGGWGKELKDESLNTLKQIKNSKNPQEKASQIKGIGKKKSKKIINNINRNIELLKLGLYDSNNIKKILENKLSEIKNNKTAHIDKPVTYDVNRLIRCPNSLHGKTGLKVTRIDNKEQLEKFKPFKDAVPERFKNNDLKVKITTEETETIGINEKLKIKPNEEKTLKEHKSIYLLLNEKAELP